jgi:fatty-acyl-CoA synthase
VLPDCHLDPRSVIDMIETQRPTVAGAVPTIWNDVMHWLEKDPGHDISSLRLVICGGSAVPVSLMRIFEEKHDVQIRQLWGMTETSPLATMAWPPRGTPEDQHWAFRGTAGQTLCGVEARIVNDDGQALPNDGKAIGEVEVRGPWITGSYYRGRDASKFESGWLRTGDVGRIDEQGFITLTDRAKDVIKSGGEWISSVELENCLVGHPDVLEAAVVGVADERWQERPLAVVVVNEGASITAGELLCGRDSPHQRGQVRQEDHPVPIRGQRIPGHRGARLIARADGVERGHEPAGHSMGNRVGRCGGDQRCVGSS